MKSRFALTKKWKWLEIVGVIFMVVLVWGCEVQGTATVVVEETQSPTQTNTEVLPMDTLQPTDTPTPEPTDTPVPTDTPTTLPTETVVEVEIPADEPLPSLEGVNRIIYYYFDDDPYFKITVTEHNATIGVESRGEFLNGSAVSISVDKFNQVLETIHKGGIRNCTDSIDDQECYQGVSEVLLLYENSNFRFLGEVESCGEGDGDLCGDLASVRSELISLFPNFDDLVTTSRQIDTSLEISCNPADGPDYNTETVEINSGELFSLTLCCDWTCQMWYDPEISDQNVVVFLHNITSWPDIPQYDEETGEPLDGNCYCSTDTWIFEALSIGNSRIILEHDNYDWGTFELDVTVK